MKKYKFIEIIELDNGLKLRNITLGTPGILIDTNHPSAKVLLQNDNNWGEYCVVEVPKNLIKETGDVPMSLGIEIEEFLKNTDTSDNIKFSTPKFKEYDVVELIVEKERYSKHGIHKGMEGVIMEKYAINNKWLVIFSDNFGKDIADICIDQNDIEKKKTLKLESDD